MGRRGNFGAQKRQKELKKKKKREEKLERKRLRKLGVTEGQLEEVGDESAAKDDKVLEPGVEKSDHGGR